MTRYNLGFTDPYYTLDGVALGYNLGYTSRNAYAANLASYNTNITNAGVNFGIPLNEFDRIGFDVELKRTEIENTTLSSDTILKFLGFNQGDPLVTKSKSFNTLSTSVGWTHDTLDRATFAHSGGQQRVSGLITVPGSDLEYFKIGYKHQHYFPLSNDFTFRLLGEVAHGDSYGGASGLPFFENYFAGGTNDVRGFMQNTLGIIDTNDLNPTNTFRRPVGGSTKLIGKAELFFPVPFLSDVKSVRIGSFIDAGTLAPGLNTGDLKKYFRYSVGLSGEWLSPFGALAVSVAQPMSTEDTDRIQAFQFTFGSGF